MMARMIIALTLVVVVSAQDPNFQQGLSVHNAQIQAHLAKEAEVARLAGPGPQQSRPQQYQQPQQYQGQGQGQQYQAGGEDDGQYRPELYENQQTRSAAPQQSYQQQGPFQGQGQFQGPSQSGNALGAGISDPAYQQGLQLHQRQIQNHIAQEQQHGGPGYQAPQQSYQNQQQYSAPPPQYQQQQQNYNSAPRGSGAQAEFQSGIAAHMQQLLEHSRAEQQHQALIGQTSQYHASQGGPSQGQGQNYRG